MDISKVAARLRRMFAENIDERVLLSEKRYFKEPVKTHGVRISQVTHIGKQLYKSIGNESKEDIFSLCEELWQLFPIILSAYQSIWEEKYLSEEKELKETIDKETVYRIRHIGSTAVPGLLAKPTIDILMEIYENTDTDRLIQLLEGVGYTMEGFKGQAVHLHVRYPGDWDEPYFCDYLKNNPDISEEYGRLKVSLQVKFRNNRDGYTAAKTDFIRKYTALARAEQQEC